MAVDGVKTVGGAVADGAKVCGTLSQPQTLLHSRVFQSGVGAVGSGLGAVVDAGKVIALRLSLANCCAHCSYAERCQFRRRQDRQLRFALHVVFTRHGKESFSRGNNCDIPILCGCFTSINSSNRQGKMQSPNSRSCVR
jgi:hypothetical protein